MSAPCQQRNAREACTGTKCVNFCLNRHANCLATELIVGTSTKVSGSKRADIFTKQKCLAGLGTPLKMLE